MSDDMILDLIPVLVLAVQMRAVPPGVCAALPTSLEPVAGALVERPVTLRYTLDGLVSGAFVSVTITGATSGFGPSDTRGAVCEDGTCVFEPRFPFSPGAYTWTVRAIDREAGCVGAPSALATFSVL